MRALEVLAAEDVAGCDQAEFGQIFEQHHRALCRLAYLLSGGDRCLAEDAVSQAFVATFPRWRQGAVLEPGAYLRRAVVNQLTGAFRRRALERRTAVANWAGETVTVGDEAAVDDRDELWDALLRLGARQRAAVVLRYYSDLSERETAAAMGCSVGTVKSQTARALARLRAVLGGATDA